MRIIKYVLLAALVISMSCSMCVYAGPAEENSLLDLEAYLWEISDDASEEDAVKLALRNFKFIRSVKAVFTEDSYDNYAKVYNKVYRKNTCLDTAIQLRDAQYDLVQTDAIAERVWFLWNEDNMPMIEDEPLDEETLDANNQDGYGFRPFVLKFLVEDQSNVRGNIVLAMKVRNNIAEGYPTVERFNDLGFNVFMVQRRSDPYSDTDGAADFQRAVRMLRYYGPQEGIGALDRIAVLTFSGADLIMHDLLSNFYGSITPADALDPDYIPDEIDAINSNPDVAMILYGYTDTPISEENTSLPAIYLCVGSEDEKGAYEVTMQMYKELKDRTDVKLNVIEGAKHTFGAGDGVNVAEECYEWPEDAAAFIEEMSGHASSEAVSTQTAVFAASYRACEHRDSYTLQPDSHEATDTEKGLRHYVCSECGAEYSYETDPLIYTDNVNIGNIGASNPLVAEWDFLPDPRPHVYWSRDDQEWRVYVYGAHDINGVSGGGPEYPLWSAPVYDLSSWRNEGLILELPEGKLVATDCGYDVMTDSYYLLADYANPENRIDVLISDNPRGKWNAEDVVASVSLKYAYNPSIYAENGTLYLSGAAYKGCLEECGRTDIIDAMAADNYKVKHVLAIHKLTGDPVNGYTIEKSVFPGTPDQIYLPVYEGISMTGWVEDLQSYVVVFATDEYDENEQEFYSTMAYAYTDDLMSEQWFYGDNGVENDILDYPGDLGMSGNHGNTVHDGSGRFVLNPSNGNMEFTGFPTYTYDNNQGGIAKINGQWYLFGQRHVNNEGCNRQAIAEKLTLGMTEEGTPQIRIAECTSSGVSDYLDAFQVQRASSACYMLADINTPAKILEEIDPDMPYITVTRDPEAVHASYVTNIHSGAVIGYKYFGFDSRSNGSAANKIKLLISPENLATESTVDIYLDAPSEDQGGTRIGTVSLTTESSSEETGTDGREWFWVSSELDQSVSGVHAIYLIFNAGTEGCICSLDQLVFE